MKVSNIIQIKGEKMNSNKKEKNTNTYRKTAKIVGILFITATVATILNQIILEPILDTTGYFVNISANENQVIVGLLFELINAIACAGIAISIFSILYKYNVSLAIGYVGFRVIEATIGFVAISSRLLLLTLSQEYIKVGNSVVSNFHNLGTLLLAGYDWTFLIMLIVFCLGALMFYYILYHSRLVPRIISVWGLIGAIMALAAFLLKMFGLISNGSMISNLLVFPIAVNEMVLAVWLIIKGFHSPSVTTGLK